MRWPQGSCSVFQVVSLRSDSASVEKPTHRLLLLSVVLTTFLGPACDAMNIPPSVARKRPESWIPALSITKWLRGSDLNRRPSGYENGDSHLGSLILRDLAPRPVPRLLSQICSRRWGESLRWHNFHGHSFRFCDGHLVSPSRGRGCIGVPVPSSPLKFFVVLFVHKNRHC